MTRYTFKSPSATEKINAILGLLKNRRLTEPEISEFLGTSRNTARMYLKHMRDRKLIHIASWTRKPVAGMTGRIRAQYKVGSRKDAPRIARKDPMQINNEYIKRVRANPEKYERAYRRLKAADARKSIRERNERLKRLQAAGYIDPIMGSLVTHRLMLGEKRRSLTPQQVSEIITLREQGTPWRKISTKVGVAASTARSYYKRIA